ncbi:DUF1707 domain-containing protein [Rhodococcus triatomae]|uniref:DUF1707 domain-containing protein n=1 Tax=Rhodococcus triatomae TaxID=300028 RepID=A0A1G8GQR7_9NOCA|nr:DUF1707 domain-containing protein [Rhodococcus triatomae]QNG20321.1 DUF1707 domain-containing protein [Rhodococcus triatomae]QNG23763.1 DUF1707 domain-containing protein [Rhodococcus triatomae]SDH96734.1 protein of unknown function [Rhodococcus triatomae]
MEARNLRVSDAEREHVGELLQRAVGQGMLSLGEFTERMDTALAAKTRGELNAVLVDLPGVQLSPEYLPAPDPVHVPPPVPHSVQHPPLPHSPHPPVPPGLPPHAAPQTVVKGRMSSVDRSGRWTVPPELLVDSKMSNVSLDFTRAVMSTQVVHLTIDDYCSSISLTVPPEATADINGIETIGATASSKVRTGPPYGPLHLVVHGKVRFGTVNVRYPLGTTIRRMFGRG